MNEIEIFKTIEKNLNTILLLLLEARESSAWVENNKKGHIKKIESLLSQAGYKPSEIAKLLGKNVEAVKKTLQRSKK
jgi:heterodisulfide reductase subunit A-like polyferredoxin